jgi:hypothetical protein
MRDFQIEDEGEEVQVAFLLDGVQVGGAMFPASADASVMAYQAGMGWAGFPSATGSVQSLH